MFELSDQKQKSIVYVYIDESGSLGYKEISGKWFVFASIITQAPNDVANCVRKTKSRRLPNKHIDELKWSKSNHDVKEYLLTCISKLDEVRIVPFIVYKPKVYGQGLRNDVKKAYNYFAGQLIRIIVEECENTHFKFITDRWHQNVFDQVGFDFYQSYPVEISGNTSEFIHMDSRNDYCIQAVDFVAGAYHHWARKEWCGKYAQIIRSHRTT